MCPSQAISSSSIAHSSSCSTLLLFVYASHRLSLISFGWPRPWMDTGHYTNSLSRQSKQKRSEKKKKKNEEKTISQASKLSGKKKLKVAVNELNRTCECALCARIHTLAKEPTTMHGIASCEFAIQSR